MTPPDGETRTAWTPGPWRAFKHGLIANKNVEWLVEQDRLGGRLVAISNTGEQDARLIASAPAMREALEKIANGRELRHPDGRTVVVDRDDAADIARAALRLALPQGDGGD